MSLALLLSAGCAPSDSEGSSAQNSSGSSAPLAIPSSSGVNSGTAPSAQSSFTQATSSSATTSAPSSAPAASNSTAPNPSDAMGAGGTPPLGSAAPSTTAAAGSGGSGGSGGQVSATAGTAGTDAFDAGGEPLADAGDPNETAAVVTYPTLPGAVESPLYAVRVNGEPLFVEKMTKFAPEMQVHYAHCSLAADTTAQISVDVAEDFAAHTLSPKSRNLAVTREGNSLSFSSGPNYLILQIDDKELLFILLDAKEVNAPALGDANVISIADYDVDNTGETLETAKIQAAIDAASGAAQNVLYFPPGKYLVGELWLKSDMTLYLAGGALLYGSNTPSDFETGSGGINIENCTHGMLRLYQINNTQILGRGVIDSNGKAIRAQNDTKLNLIKIEESADILIDGVVVRDPSFWNTLIYRSNRVTIENYKMINCRPTTTEWNNTDGVNFDESTNGRLYNAFLYTGDDSIATKNEEPNGTVNTDNILHEKVVCYTNSVGCKIGTKTMGQSMTNIVFRDIDVVRAGRALNIDAYDTAVVEGTVFEDIRVEAADSLLIALEETQPPDWREAANESIIRNTSFINIASEVDKPIELHAKSLQFGIDGVHFKNVTVSGQPITSVGDPDATWSVNEFVTDITFE